MALSDDAQCCSDFLSLPTLVNPPPPPPPPGLPRTRRIDSISQISDCDYSEQRTAAQQPERGSDRDRSDPPSVRPSGRLPYSMIDRLPVIVRNPAIAATRPSGWPTLLPGAPGRQVDSASVQRYIPKNDQLGRRRSASCAGDGSV